jgi:hypothetical protein
VSDFYAQINIKAPSQHIKLKPYQLNNYILSLNIQNKQSLKPIANFPFAIKVVSGQANIETNNKLVNENGNLNFKINSFGTKSKVHSFKISIDKEDLFNEYIKSNNLLAIDLYKKINCETTIEIEIESLLVFIKSNEKAFNVKTKEQFLANAIKSYLLQNGVSITNNINEANYYLTIEANTTKGNIAYGMQVVYLDAAIVLNKSKNTVFTKNFNGVKGLKATESNASYDSYQKLISKFEEELYADLLKEMGLINNTKE